MASNHVNPYQAYQTASATVDTGAQIVMLYDGAIKFMQQGCEAIKEKKYKISFKSIDNACAIINGLASSLDVSRNKEIAEALDEYYHSLDVRMMLFQHNHDMQTYDNIIEDLRAMRESWKDAIAKTSH